MVNKVGEPVVTHYELLYVRRTMLQRFQVFGYPCVKTTIIKKAYGTYSLGVPLSTAKMVILSSKCQ
jgi:hypothetical protein